jgi:uncharacterized protein YjgD (DUF1641 family)
MENKNLQTQIDDINRKLDIVLEEVMAQKQTRQSLEDLSSDISIIGQDMFASTVTELENAGVEVDGEAVKVLALKLIRNIDTLSEVFEMMESGRDLLKDLSPIVQQVGLDGMHLMNEFEQKGYFDFMRESAKIIDNVVTHFTVEDVTLLANNIVTIMETVKSLTQPDMLKAINSALVVYKSIDLENVEEYSMFKAFREMNSKEMRKGLGFMITFLKNIAKATNTNNN